MRLEKHIAKKFREELESFSTIVKGSSGVLAVSGGVDSVVMTHLFYQIQIDFELDLIIAHFNHTLRGYDSDEDERFVANLAKTLNLPFVSDQWNLVEKSNLEAQSRKARYSFLEKQRDKIDYDWIATAHHADDQSETVLMRLIEGGGYRGLRGIPRENGKVIRPLLSFSKKELIVYAERMEFSYRKDLSNSNNRFHRNKIRNVIIPKIKELNPNFVRTLDRSVDRLVEVSNFIDREVRILYPKVVSINQEGFLQIDEKILKKAPILIQKELIRVITDENTLPWRGHVWDELHLFLLESSVGNIMTLPGNYRILRDRNCFFLTQDSCQRTQKTIYIDSSRPVNIQVERYCFNMSFNLAKPSLSDNPAIEFIDYTKLSGSLGLRRWRPGDRMVPLGMDGKKKVSDILVDEKVNRFSKENQFVLSSSNEIVWLCGLRIDERFKVRDTTTSVAKLNWQRK